MLCTKYQGSGPCGFRQEYFFHFTLYIIAYVKPVTPGQGQWPWGIILTNLVESISCFPYKGLCKTCDPWAGHF